MLATPGGHHRARTFCSSACRTATAAACCCCTAPLRCTEDLPGEAGGVGATVEAGPALPMAALCAVVRRRPHLLLRDAPTAPGNAGVEAAVPPATDIATLRVPTLLPEALPGVPACRA